MAKCLGPSVWESCLLARPLMGRISGWRIPSAAQFPSCSSARGLWAPTEAWAKHSGAHWILSLLSLKALEPYVKAAQWYEKAARPGPLARKTKFLIRYIAF